MGRGAGTPARYAGGLLRCGADWQVVACGFVGHASRHPRALAYGTTGESGPIRRRRCLTLVSSQVVRARAHLSGTSSDIRQARTATSWPAAAASVVADLLADCDPQAGDRALDEYGRDVSPPDPMVERPYTDLAYWSEPMFRARAL